MRAALPWMALLVTACDQGQAGIAQSQMISCGFQNAGSMVVDATVKSSLPVPPEARNPRSFDLEGQITGDRFAGKLTNLRWSGSDVIYREDVQGVYDKAGGLVSFSTKDSLRYSVWPKPDLPDQERSRAILLGDLNELETASVFVGACGTD